MSYESNLDRLTSAGIIPDGYDKLSDAEKATINGMSEDEVKAIISASAKMGPEFLAKHAPHGMAY
jgi:hypothetical protein